ncbi:hypothetical protein ROLI_033130 [Roseobacter fucihabitans]|uniref:Uncharacterized protein n=1 Tax=Roseobacter fucihabitans TaxID=1537242 RepID=A0ABZ2BY21_9RHOB|nr:hypothetical protein [Roseobacter litoralis]
MSASMRPPCRGEKVYGQTRDEILTVQYVSYSTPTDIKFDNSTEQRHLF